MELGKAVRGMRHKVATAGRILLGREWAERNMTILPDDVFLVSYPRSGNTWLRFLIGNMIHTDTPVTFANVESLLPFTDLHCDRVLLRAPRPRILKSHEGFFARYPRVIYIVRDPRDVAVSYYHFHVKSRDLAEGFSIDQYVRLFVGAEQPDGRLIGPWADHVRGWVKMRQGTYDFLLLRYEDLLKDTQHELARAADFLRVRVTPERLARAVEMSSADRMRSLEKAQWRLWKTTRRSRADKPFVRTADAGDWKRFLEGQSVAAIESAWAPAMRALGYQPVTDRAGAVRAGADALP